METPRAKSKDTTPSIIIAELAFMKTQEEKEHVEQELAAERLAVLQKREENERLRQELLARESQSDQLRLSNTMLEAQIGKQSAMLDSLKQSTGKADEALEVRTLKSAHLGIPCTNSREFFSFFDSAWLGMQQSARSFSKD